MFAINKALLPIKAHFFLYSGLEMMRRMLPLIFRERGVPTEAVGMAYSIMTLLGLAITAIGGTLADRFLVHRNMLIITLFVATFGVTSIYFIPDVSKAAPESLNTMDKSGVVERSVVLQELMELEGTGLFKSSDIKKHSLNETSKHYLAELLVMPEFILLVLCASTEQSTIGLVYSLTDTIVFKVLDGDNTRYGQQRMFNAIGVAINAAIAGYLVDWYSEGLDTRDPLPAFAICFALMVFDISILCSLDVPIAKKVMTDNKIAKSISDLFNFKTLLFLMLVFVLGFAMNFMFVLKCLLADDIVNCYDPDFNHSKLLQGLMISIQCLSASFIYGLTGFFIRWLGHTKVFILGLCFLGSHFVIYFFISNPWFILPLEMLHGPSYSLLSATAASYACKIAPTDAIARLQASSQFSFFLGYVVSGFVGSYMYKLFGGYYTFFILGCFIFFFNLFYSLCKTILNLNDRLASKNVEVIKQTDLESDSIYQTSSQTPIKIKSGHFTSLNDSFMADFKAIDDSPYFKNCGNDSLFFTRKLSQSQLSQDSGVLDEFIESTMYSEDGFNVTCATLRKPIATPNQSTLRKPTLTPHQSTMVLSIEDGSPSQGTNYPTSPHLTVIRSIRRAVSLSPNFRKNVDTSSKSRKPKRLHLWDLPDITDQKLE